MRVRSFMGRARCGLSQRDNRVHDSPVWPHRHTFSGRETDGDGDASGERRGYRPLKRRIQTLGMQKVRAGRACPTFLARTGELWPQEPSHRLVARNAALLTALVLRTNE